MKNWRVKLLYTWCLVFFALPIISALFIPLAYLIFLISDGKFGVQTFTNPILNIIFGILGFPFIYIQHIIWKYKYMISKEIEQYEKDSKNNM
jgi:hypothetical protein